MIFFCYIESHIRYLLTQVLYTHDRHSKGTMRSFTLVVSALLLQGAMAFLPVARLAPAMAAEREHQQQHQQGVDRRGVLGQVGSVLGGLGALSLLPSVAAAKGVKVRALNDGIDWALVLMCCWCGDGKGDHEMMGR